MAREVDMFDDLWRLRDPGEREEATNRSQPRRIDVLQPMTPGSAPGRMTNRENSKETDITLVDLVHVLGLDCSGVEGQGLFFEALG